jgi:hypothetical protein
MTTSKGARRKAGSSPYRLPEDQLLDAAFAPKMPPEAILLPLEVAQDLGPHFAPSQEAKSDPRASGGLQ